MESSQLVGNLLTVSAPSGAGKTSLVRDLIAQDDQLTVAVSHTTRPMRPGEVDGANYHFVSQHDFAVSRNGGEFFEWAEVFGHFYGTARSEVESRRQAGLDVILEIDWQGARQVKVACPESRCIFILPPSISSLEERLRLRGQDDEPTIERRMAEARSELVHWRDADFLVLNDRFENALSDLRTIVRSLRLKRHYQARYLSQVLEDF